MKASLAGWRKRLLSISPEEVTFARRGFRGGDPKIRSNLETVGRTFLHGYHLALQEDDPETLAQRLNEVERDRAGFAYEGAAMGLALCDQLSLWNRSRWRAFVHGPGAAHVYMVHVGAGWVLARLPWLRASIDRFLRPLDPLFRWLAIDGYGFHEGYFSWRRTVEAQEVPARLAGYARRAFDLGLGRSLWFVDGADVTRIPATIAAFPPARQADLWSGIGLASTYAGGVSEADLRALRDAAGGYRPQLAQGAAFAAKARQRAGNLVEHTELACQVHCGVSAPTAAELTDRALAESHAEGAEPLFEIWRQRIQATFSKMEVLTP